MQSACQVRAHRNRTECACALMHLLVSCDVRAMEDIEPAGKSVLMSFRENRRVLTLPPSSQSTVSELDLLLALCHSEVGSLMPAKPDACMVTLQVKDKAWGGIFVDYTKPFVDDRAVQRVSLLPTVIASVFPFPTVTVSVLLFPTVICIVCSACAGFFLPS